MPPAPLAPLETDFGPQILHHHAQAMRAGHQAHRCLLDAAAHALECGRLLAQQKALLPHGRWLEWLRRSAPKLPARTAQRYMQFAAEWERSKTSRVTLLPSELPSLRQLYVEFGILRAPELREPAPAGLQSFLEPVFRLLESPKVRTMMDSDPGRYDPRQREMLREKLRPLVDFYQRL